MWISLGVDRIIGVEMKINVISTGSWIIGSISRKLCNADPETFRYCSLGAMNIQGAQGYYYADVQGAGCVPLYDEFPDKVHIGWFTHIDKDDPKTVKPWTTKFDGIVHMCQRYYNVFLEQGWYPAERMTIIRPGQVDKFPLKKLKIGIAQRGGHIGKGSEFLPNVINGLPQEIRDGIQLQFIGTGWERDRFLVECIEWREDDNVYPAFFQNIDWLLIPSRWEGGPLGLLEALATGTPIIASDVGWVPEFFQEIYESRGNWTSRDVFKMYHAGDVGALSTILRHLVSARLELRNSVKDMSYANYAGKLLEFFKHIKELKSGSIH